MRHGSREVRNFTRLAFLMIFGVAFGFVEAAAAYYLRLLITYRFANVLTRYHVLFNLGFITFVRPTHSLLISRHVTNVEVTREAATIVMLLAVSLLAATTWRARLGALMVSFACWDIAYYVFLKVIDNWPASLMTKDVYFLIPVMWIGPVITPLVISTGMLIGGAVLFVRWSTAGRNQG